MALKQIWTDVDYVYSATTSGLGVTSTLTEELVNFIPYEDGLNSVWADSTRVYLATNSSGIKYVNIETIETATSLVDYNKSLFLSGSEINYLHGADNYLMCCTTAGVDVIRLDDVGSVTHTLISGTKKCFTTGSDFYYTVSSGVVEYLNRVDRVHFNWTGQSSQYTTGSGFLRDATCLLDFYVTEGTSNSGINNTLFIATTSGAYVYDEGSFDYAIFTTTVTGARKYPILVEQNVNFLTSIWAEPDAGLNNSMMYIASSGVGATFSVIDLSTKTLYDRYLIDSKGILNEYLEGEDAVDINVVSL